MNTIPVITLHKDIPYTRIDLWFPGGSSLESAEELGWAHLIEHLLFKLKINNIGIAEFVESRGGHSNAFTSHDAVVVEVTIANRHAHAALEYLQKLFALPLTSIGSADFIEERGVVIEELRMYDDEPTEDLFHAVSVNLWGEKHPYGRRIIGTEQTLAGATLAKLEKFFRRKMFAAPFLVAGGGLSELKNFTLGPVSGYTGKIPEPVIITNTAITRHRQRKDYCMAAWKLPQDNGDQAAMLRLIHTIAYGMDGGRFYNEIVYEKAIFDNMSLSILPGYCGSSFIQSGAFDPGREEGRLKYWLTAWEKLTFNQEELARAREVIFSNRCFSSEGIGDAVERAGRSYHLYQDQSKFDRDYFYTLFNTDAKTLTLFKERYLSYRDAVIGVALPEKSRFSFKGSLAKEAKAIDLSERFVRTIKPGIRCGILQREDSPFASIYIAKKGGLLGDLKDKGGSFNLFIETLCNSAEGMSKQETEDYLDRFGIMISPVTGNNTGGIRMKVRDSFIDEGLTILDKILKNKLDPDEFKQEKQYLISILSLKNEDPSFLLRKALHKALFEGTPYENTTSGTEESITGTSLADCRLIRKNWYQSGTWGVGIAGPSADRIRDQIIAMLPKVQSADKKLVKHQEKMLDERIIEVPVPGRRQCHILRVFRAPGVYDEDFETMRLIEQFMYGQKSPYFQLLREEQGLVYSLDVWSMSGLQSGYFALSAITSPDNKSLVMDKMQETIKQMEQGLFENDFLKEIKESLLFQHESSLIKNDFHSFNLSIEEALALPYKNYLQFPVQLHKIGRTRIIEVSKRCFANGLWLISAS